MASRALAGWPNHGVEDPGPAMVRRYARLQPVAPQALAQALGNLVESPDDPILLRGREASLQELTAVMELLRE
ncbi:hypothetical protein, partial [Streptomyces sp. P17]|uniref:hypothetical protein n=1 Tax=Streptomyces sp. P17 TaxID=3074716 RepID=UPI0028F404F7